MIAYSLFPVLLGLAVVAQAALNRRIGENWGLSSAVLLNATVLLVLSGAFFAFAKFLPHLVPEYFRSASQKESLKWWFLLPGLCGFLLVMGVPWSIRNIGATKSFILLISAQIILGLLLDKFIYQRDISAIQALGGIITMLGTALVMWR